jgi:hypothetical protein
MDVDWVFAGHCAAFTLGQNQYGTDVLQMCTHTDGFRGQLECFFGRSMESWDLRPGRRLEEMRRIN